MRSRNCLKKMNINTLGDLLRITEAELLAYKNFGETSLNEIKAMLKQKGLRLGQLQRKSRSGPRARPPPGGAARGLARGCSASTVSEIEFSVRARKCLQRLNLSTLGDLVSKTEAELLAAKNFGQTSLNEIKQKLARVRVVAPQDGLMPRHAALLRCCWRACWRTAIVPSLDIDATGDGAGRCGRAG